MKLKWSIDQLYFYLVCFVMLITIIIGVTTLVRAGIDLIIPYPEGKITRPYPPYDYRDPIADASNSQLPASVIEQELELQEQFMQDRNRQNTINQAIRSILQGIAMLIVAFPVYLYHWRKIPMLA